MRSSPLLLLALVIVGFAFAAIPLTRLTAAKPTAPIEDTPSLTATTSSPTADTVETRVRIRFAHRPESIRIEQSGHLLVETAIPEDDLIEQQIDLFLTDETCELLVHASWPAGTPQTALTIDLEPSGREARSATSWTDTETLSEMMFFTWP